MKSKYILFLFSPPETSSEESFTKQYFWKFGEVYILIKKPNISSDEF